MTQPETNTRLLMEFDSVRMRSNMVLVAIFKKVKISKFSKTPINFKISKKSKKKSENFKLSTFKIFKEKNQNDNIETSSPLRHKGGRDLCVF